MNTWRAGCRETRTSGSGGRLGETDRWKHRHRAPGRPHKDCGFGRFPSRTFAINQAWLELALTGIDLLAWTQHLLLDGELALAEPKKLRYRLLYVAARLTRTARQTRLRIGATWPWTTELATAFTRLAALPQPIN
jgi:Transposase DDE domain group 1